MNTSGATSSSSAKHAPDDPAADVAAARERAERTAVRRSACHGFSPPACRAGPWAGRSGSAPGTGTAGSARSGDLELQQRVAEGLGRDVHADRLQPRRISELVDADREGLDARRSAARRRRRRRASPCRRPPPPRRSTEPTVAAMPGSVTKALPPITPARPASAQPPPNTSMKTRGTLWPERLHRLRVRERGLDHQADARAREQQPDRDQHQQRHQHHEAAVHRETACRYSVNSGPVAARPARGSRTAARPQISCTSSRMRRTGRR